VELVVRALTPGDADAARALVSEQFARTGYRVRALELLESALRFDDPEYVGLLAVDEDGARLLGLVLFGTVAGARGVLKLHGVVAHEREPALVLLEAVRQAGERSGERMIVCELPDDAPFGIAADALEASGFAEEGRVPDFVRDGVALRLLVRPLYSA
jgi:hypothetical protein